MRTGPCSVRSRRPCRDGNEPAGSSHPTPCCVGIHAESPATGPNPAGRRAGPALLWSCVVSSSAWPPATRHGATAVACDFVTVDTALLRRYYLLFFIDITNREVLYGGITANPTGAWTTQAARNLFVRHPDRFTHTRALVRDRASQFVNDFDEIFRSEGLKILRTPVRVPVANAFAERWIGTLRRELVDRTIIWNQHQLQRLAIDYIAHYNTRTGPTVHSTSDHPSPPTPQTSQTDTSKS